MPRIPQPAPATLLGMTPYLLDQVGRAARRDLASRLAGDLGLSLRELFVLAVVAEGQTDAKGVEERLGLDRDTVREHVRGLCDRGLLSREKMHDFAVTKQGRRALARATLAAKTVTAALLAPLEPDELVSLHAWLAAAYATYTHSDD